MRSLADTIVAPISGSSPAPVAIVRLSGPESWRIASRVFHPWPDRPEPLKAVYGVVCEKDDGIALPFAEGRSYTGERTAEISLHGSIASVRGLVEACIAHGARMAEPGEFTLRAFLNGRVDLTQAEGIRDTVNAKTEAQLRQAALHRTGKLREEVRRIRDRIARVLAAVEASVDFSEEIGELDRASAGAALDGARDALLSLVESSHTGRLIRDGIRVVIAGRPNAGKSSLFNAVLGASRAIVTDVPGTTRDYVEEQVERDGLLWVFVDTAGLRQTQDRVECIGVSLAREKIESADVVWYVYDASRSWTDDDEANAKALAAKVVVLANKSDLAASPPRGIPTCALDGSGLEEAFRATSALLNLEAVGDRPLLNLRQTPLVARALSALECALGALEDPVPDDLVAVGLYDALDALGQITGETASEDLLQRMFSDFCIGK